MIRGKKVMLDRDLAELYEIERFPDDFMFKLTKKEFEDLISQFVMSRWGGVRKLPYVFTEQGVAMLSSVLNSKRAIMVNIQIMRAFIKIKEMLSTHADLKRKIEAMERKYDLA